MPLPHGIGAPQDAPNNVSSRLPLSEICKSAAGTHPRCIGAVLDFVVSVSYFLKRFSKAWRASVGLDTEMVAETGVFAAA